MIHNIYNQQKNKQKDNKDKTIKSFGTIEQKHQAFTKSKDIQPKLLTKDKSYSSKNKETSNTKSMEEDLKLTKQDFIGDTYKEIDNTEYIKSSSNNVLSVFVKNGLGNLVSSDNLELNSPSSFRNSNLNEGKIVYPTFNKKSFLKSFSIKEELTQIETKKLRNLYIELDKLLTDKDKEIISLRKSSNNPNGGFRNITDVVTFENSPEVMRLKQGLETEKNVYEEKINRIKIEKDKFVESFSRVYEEKVEKYENLNKLLIEEKERLRRELSSLKLKMEEEKSEIANSYEIKIANLKKEMNNLKIENNNINYEYNALKQEYKQMYPTQDVTDFKKTSSNVPSSDLKPSYVPRPSSNLSERIPSKYGKQSISNVKSSSPRINETYGPHSPVDKYLSSEINIKDSKPFFGVVRREHHRNLSGGVSTLESTEDKKILYVKKPIFRAESTTFTNEGFNQLCLEISKLNLEILSKWSIDKEKDTIKSNDLRIKYNNLLKDYSSKVAFMDELTKMNEIINNELEEYKKELKETEEENQNNIMKLQDEISNIDIKLNNILEIKGSDNVFNNYMNRTILEKIRLVQMKLNEYRDALKQVEIRDEQRILNIIVSEGAKIFIQRKIDKSYFEGNLKDNDIKEKLKLELNEKEKELKMLLEEKIGEKIMFDEKEKNYEKLLTEMKNNLEKIRQEKKDGEYHFSIKFEENCRMKSEKLILEEKLNKSQKENKKLLEELEKLRMNSKVDNNIVEELRVKNENLLKDQEISSSEIKKLNELMNKYSNQLEVGKNENENLKTENRCLQKQIDYYVSLVSEKENVILSLVDSTKENQTMKQSNLKLLNQLNEVQERLTRLQEPEEMEYSHFSFELLSNEKLSQKTLSNMIDVLNCLLDGKENQLLQCNI